MLHADQWLIKSTTDVPLGSQNVSTETHPVKDLPPPSGQEGGRTPGGLPPKNRAHREEDHTGKALQRQVQQVTQQSRGMMYIDFLVLH